MLPSRLAGGERHPWLAAVTVAIAGPAIAPAGSTVGVMTAPCWPHEAAHVGSAPRGLGALTGTMGDGKPWGDGAYGDSAGACILGVLLLPLAGLWPGAATKKRRCELLKPCGGCGACGPAVPCGCCSGSCGTEGDCEACKPCDPAAGSAAAACGGAPCTAACRLPCEPGGASGTGGVADPIGPNAMPAPRCLAVGVKPCDGAVRLLAGLHSSGPGRGRRSVTEPIGSGCPEHDTRALFPSSAAEPSADAARSHSPELSEAAEHIALMPWAQMPMARTHSSRACRRYATSLRCPSSRPAAAYRSDATSRRCPSSRLASLASSASARAARCHTTSVALAAPPLMVLALVASVTASEMGISAGLV